MMISQVNPMVWVVLGVVLFVLIWIIGMYNLLVRLRQHVRESWSGIDTELKRRYDLIPNLVNTVKGYAAHEKDVLENVTAARTAAQHATGSAGSQAKVENELIHAVETLMARAEAYPDLKASENFLSLQRELVNTEDRIQAARRFYNANVRDMNTRVEVFPSNIMASMFGFQKEEFFEVESLHIRQPVNVNL